MKLTKIERLLLMALLQTQNNQRRILEALGKSANDIPDANANANAIEVLMMGAEHFYDNAFGCLGAQLNDDGGISQEESSEILDVLDMYRGIGDYMEANPKDDEVSKHTFAHFGGFDGNHESRRQWFVNFAVSKMELYDELKGGKLEESGFNSHGFVTMTNYRPMVEAWKKVDNQAKLTRDEVLSILGAAK